MGRHIEVIESTAGHVAEELARRGHPAGGSGNNNDRS
jgi:hypothetical protein